MVSKTKLTKSTLLCSVLGKPAFVAHFNIWIIDPIEMQAVPKPEVFDVLKKLGIERKLLLSHQPCKISATAVTGIDPRFPKAGKGPSKPSEQKSYICFQKNIFFSNNHLIETLLRQLVRFLNTKMCIRIIDSNSELNRLFST